jgi:hypothetical protein
MGGKEESEVMEPIAQEMRDMAVNSGRSADSYIQIRRGHLFVNPENREKAQSLLHKFQQGYPSNKKVHGFRIGTRFTWKRLKELTDMIYLGL